RSPPHPPPFQPPQDLSRFPRFRLNSRRLTFLPPMSLPGSRRHLPHRARGPKPRENHTRPFHSARFFELRRSRRRLLPLFESGLRLLQLNPASLYIFY